MAKHFKNRAEAARQLSEKLIQYRGKNPLILAIPRGAVPMGKIIAKELKGELDVVLIGKLGAPHNPEYAIGAIDESGWTYLQPEINLLKNIDAYLEQEKERKLLICQQRRMQYTPIKQAINPEGRVVIIIDDGLATGSTMITALHAIRAKNPAKLICAVPVSPPETLEKIAEYADNVVCVKSPENFFSVGQFYRDFTQVSDSEVEQALAET